MRLNKNVESKFKYRYDWVMEDFRASLIVIACISVLMNAMSSPVLGFKALLIFIVSWFAARLTEIIFMMFSKDLEYSAAAAKVNEGYPEISGLIFALLIPIGTPLYAIIVSLALAIIIAKVAFGGFSYNIFNVGVVAAVICYVSWPDSVSTVLNSNYWLDYILIQVSNLLATPLGGIFAMPEIVTTNTLPNAASLYPTWSIFTNNPQVFLGMIPTVIVLPIGIRLIYNEVIDYQVPLMISGLAIIGGFIVGILAHDLTFLGAIWYGFNGLFGTILLFVALFVANDPVTTPHTTNTKLMYSMIVVVVTLFIREVSSNIEGVLFAILFANMLVPLLNAKSGVLALGLKRKLLVSATLLFGLSTIFISCNVNLEAVDYSQYDHYAMGNDQSASCQPIDSVSSATTEEPATTSEPGCEQSAEGTGVDAVSSATVE